ncbi:MULTISPECIES: hypothetical protein [Haloarcula]|uniref:hypothetical protein n=1 Tax=Haloarcula TaxID=2237 RepID=UPI0023EA7C42|nr:hypothetical protein [Halomicroarcula sp. XH51]
MTSDSTCDYVFDLAEWREDRGRDFRLEESVPTGWSCDRPVEGDGACLFHRPVDETDSQAVAERLVEEVATPAAETDVDAVAENRFLGAEFDDVSLSHLVLEGEGNRPIDLRFSTVAGALELDRLVTTNPIRLVGTVVEGETTFHRAQIRADFDVSDAVFRGPVDFTDATFSRHVWAIHAEFGSGTSFDRCSVGEDLCLAGADIGGNLRLADAEVDGYSCFSRIDCTGALVVEPKHVGGNLWCVRSTFETFDETNEPNNLIRGGSIEGDVVVRESTFGGKLTFEDLDVEGRFLFEDTSVAGNWVDLTGCSVPAGELGQPDEGHVTYDFTDATIGDVRLQDVPGNGFERIFFTNTTFDGFDFGRHRPLLLRSNWTIHTVADGPIADTQTESGPLRAARDRLASLATPVAWFGRSLLGRTAPGVDEKSLDETTYLKAKNGANKAGDNKAAARFFQKELAFRRKGHAEVALNGRPAANGSTTVFERLSAAGAWVANVVLAATTGYGEKPHRVLLASLATIVAFAFVFAGITHLGPGTDHPPREILLLSFQSFITFILGSPVGGDVTYALRFVSAVEGLMGAFLVALSVFALTRSVHR